jgi:NAD(P)-dependent dehydrogenase (short-subunit alcohol dehydrogenase family)
MNLEKFSLENKSAIVTGAGGLLGVQHSVALAEAGAKVYCSDLTIELAQSAVNKVKEICPNAEVLPVQLDVTDKKSIEATLDEVLKTSNKLDILVNNAAIDPKVKKDTDKNLSRFENFPIDDWNLQINVGLTGALLCSQVFGTHMSTSGGGVILNIASDLSVIAPDQRIYRKDGIAEEDQPVKPVTYSVIKAGLVGLTKYLSTYWSTENVRVNAISPGGVFNDHPDSFTSKLTPLIPMGRMANVDEYRGCIQFLCSEASSYMTGQNIIMDGGRSVW